MPYDPEWEKYLSGNLQCKNCGRIFHGKAREDSIRTIKPRYTMPKDSNTATDEEKAAMLYHVDEEGNTYNTAEAKARGLPFNISHGQCPACYNREEAVDLPMRKTGAALRQWSAAYKEEMERQHELSQPLPEAHTPIAEAYEPIPEARTPVPDAHQPVEQPAADSQE